ncbi:14613_t:CDS:2 [Ambispora leptoticha]|uniref:14613_t:CDS:1 n=1 Tax=Ambispora leptoticha TaxID=144679 RepID=A0A9N9BJC8_9GLOM|nr:14613_t:CDS:2 [Ambispora leptoticha]
MLEIFEKYNMSLPILKFDCNSTDMIVLVRNTYLFQDKEKSHEEVGDPSRELVDKFND